MLNVKVNPEASKAILTQAVDAGLKPEKIKQLQQEFERTPKVANNASDFAEARVKKWSQAFAACNSEHEFTELMVNTITELKTYGLAQSLLTEILHLTEHLDAELRKTSGLLSKPSKSNVSRAEMLRTVVIASYLHSFVEQLADEFKSAKKASK